MATNDSPERGVALVISCPADDLSGAAAVLEQHSCALLPVGGLGHLGVAAGVATLLVVEVGAEGPLPAVSWEGVLAPATPLGDDLEQLLPASWRQRHPDVYARCRGLSPVPPSSDAPGWDPDDDDADDDGRTQVFLPVTRLAQLPKGRWIFANELVSKQRREGRTFAPREPTIVELPVE